MVWLAVFKARLFALILLAFSHYWPMVIYGFCGKMTGTGLLLLLLNGAIHTVCAVYVW